jgi:U3 small nucleolar RNA-associated protein MPP10
MTQEFTDSLEDMIKRRCLEGRWDDVVRKAPQEGKRRRVEEEELDMEKSHEGLGEVYAREFAKQFLGAKDEDKKAARHAEVNALLDKAFAQLDALSNFHFTPKAPVQEELSVRPNVRPRSHGRQN